MKSLSNIMQLVLANWAISFHNFIIYRGNTVFFVFFEFLFFVGHIFGMNLGFKLADGVIHGWTTEQGLILGLIFNFTHQVFLTIFVNFIFNIGDKTGDGTLDFILLKPQNPLVSLFFSEKWNIANLFNLLLSGGVLVYLLRQYATNHQVEWYQWTTCFLFILLGAIFRGALGLLCVCGVFFSERVHADDTYWGMVNLANFPQAVFPRIMQAALTFVLPVMVISSVPAEALFGMKTWEYLLGAFIAGVCFIYFAIRIFHWALYHYKSVNAGGV